jgi:hypothetical protein
MNEPPESIDLAYIGRALQRLNADIGSLRDDMAVLTAIVMRQDTTLSTLLTEIRAMHAQHSRLANRVRAVEERAP